MTENETINKLNMRINNPADILCRQIRHNINYWNFVYSRLDNIKRIKNNRLNNNDR